MAEKRRIVRVACTVPNGVMIRMTKAGPDDGTGDGQKMMGHEGPGVRLNGPSSLQTGAGATERRDLAPGITEVDAEWMARWLDQNGLNPLVAQGAVRVLEENPTGA